MYFLILLSLQLYTYSSHGQSSELGTGSTTPATSPRPPAAPTLYRNNNSNLFCSPPPKRSECPSYSQVFTDNVDDHAKVSTIGPNGRPCFVNYDDVTRADTSGALDNPFTIYSTSDANVYEADIPIRFDYSSLSGPDKEKQYSDFLKRAQSCLDSGKPKITDGTRTLKVRIIPLSTELSETNISLYNSSTWISAQVDLHSSYPRADSGNYGINLDCETISHEILHILGLHDEYHESQTTYRPNKQVFEQELGINLPQSVYDSGLVDQSDFDCRRAAQEPNIMDDPTSFSPPEGYRLYQCKLSKDTGTVQRSVSLTQSRTCPTSHEQSLVGEYNSIEEINEMRALALDYFIGRNQTTRDSLVYHPLTRRDLPEASLRSGQFNQILHPNCMSRPGVRTYLSSARNAYRNRFSAEGGGQCLN